MKFRLFVVLLLSFVALLFIGQPALAKPTSFHNGYSQLSWSNGVKASIVGIGQITTPVLQNGTWEQMIFIRTSDSIDRLEAGVESVGTAGSGICGLGQHFFYKYGNVSTVCFTAFNTNHCDFGVGDKSGSTTNLAVNIDCGNGTGPCPGWSCTISQSVGQPAWAVTTLEEDVDSSWTGWLGGSQTIWQWNNNEFTNGTWVKRITPTSCPATDGCPSYHSSPPPEMYWNMYPGNFPGGVLFTCERSDGAATC